MMDTLCQSELIHTCLQASLQEILNLERQDVIELHAGFIEHTDTNETSNEGIAFKETLRVLFIEGEEFTMEERSRVSDRVHQRGIAEGVTIRRDGICLPSSTTDFGQGQHDTPYFALVAEAIFANGFELRVTT